MPNTLYLVESFEDEAYFYSVTKYMAQGDLLRHLVKTCVDGPMLESKVRRIIHQLVKAVAGFHSRGILHRDIKLDNILINGEGERIQVYLADLGSAIKFESPTDKTSFMIGTPGYMAPEMMRFKPFGLPYDIWSLGAVMYCLLSRSLPFWHQDQKERKRRVCKEPLDLEKSKCLSKISDDAKNLLHGMLTKNPDKRLTIDQVAAHPWFASL